MKNISIFASGSGSNAEAIIRYFQHSVTHSVVRIYCNKPTAGVIRRAESLGVPVLIFNKEEFLEGTKILTQLKADQSDAIVLAGFLWLVPEYLIHAFPSRIFNIHPALLPDFGGKNFYGEKVHQAVIDSKLPISGITIHEVNEKFDEGRILFQAACYCGPEDTAASLAHKIHALEHKYYPVVLEKILV
ncbi:MAG TPA: phosphoribosylglycinamide formyltransferase [Bacteroidia bacterium]|nr:phosphoribosylglycinamide formyltransferase [Bacteroidia bacterium]